MAKFLAILFLCFLSAALVKSELDKTEVIKKFMEYSEQCMTENGATKVDIEELIKRQPASNKNAKCMRACIMKKYKAMNADGKLDKAGAMEHAKILTDGDAEKMKIATQIIDTCGAITVPDDHCEAAIAYCHCVMEQAKLHGLDKFEM